MMKSWVLFLSAVLLLCFPSCISLASSSNELSDIEVTDQERGFMGNPRNLKESSSEKRDELKVEDYGSVDPSPTTKASIRAGPIEHGSPLNPYIPKPPSSPIHPKDGG